VLLSSCSKQAEIDAYMQKGHKITRELSQKWHANAETMRSNQDAPYPEAEIESCDRQLVFTGEARTQFAALGDPPVDDLKAYREHTMAELDARLEALEANKAYLAVDAAVDDAQDPERNRRLEELTAVEKRAQESGEPAEAEKARIAKDHTLFLE
jgi:hypothetical protein